MLNRPSLYARRSAISYAECRHCSALYVKRRAAHIGCNSARGARVA